jgi:hypothetical protein
MIKVWIYITILILCSGVNAMSNFDISIRGSKITFFTYIDENGNLSIEGTCGPFGWSEEAVHTLVGSREALEELSKQSGIPLEKVSHAVQRYLTPPES